MNPDKDSNFEQNIRQLMQLLKKILTHPPSQDALSQMSRISPFTKDSGIQLNLFFFTFFPVDSEELDELEEIYGRYLFREDKPEDFSAELSKDDLDFLQENGIKF